MEIHKISLGEYSRTRKLTDEQKSQIRIDRENGLTYRELSEKYGISQSTLSRVLKPEYAERKNAYNREYHKGYKVPREVRTARDRELKAYKRQLVAEGKIK